MSDTTQPLLPPYPSPSSGPTGGLAGGQLGNYKLVSLLGAGAFADVYLGEHIYLGSQAAIKVLAIRLASAEEIEDFRTEARTIARLTHPNIIRILDFGIQEGTAFLVMDYAPNGTLRSRHPRGVPLPPATILPYIKQVAEALQYAHDEKLIHRDIKQENMLVGRRNEVLLSDFGIALVSRTSDFRSTFQQVAGTVAYMAPEQINGHPHPASDQYALGIVAYEWLCGERPFQGSFTEMAARHLLTPPPRMRDKVPDIPQGLEVVVMTALAKEPRERFASVQAFAKAFEGACNLTVQSPPTLFPAGIWSSSTESISHEELAVRNAPTIVSGQFSSQEVVPALLPTLPTVTAPLSPSLPIGEATKEHLTLLPLNPYQITNALQEVEVLRQQIHSLKGPTAPSFPPLNPPGSGSAADLEHLFEEIRTLHEEIQQIKEAPVTSPSAITQTEQATIATIIQEMQALRFEIQRFKEATQVPPPISADPKESITQIQSTTVSSPGVQAHHRPVSSTAEPITFGPFIKLDDSALGNTLPQRKRAFISYCYADRRHLTRLKIHLAPFAERGKVDYWDETQLTPGSSWRKEIERVINSAKVAVLLISSDFLASKFITENVLPPLLISAQMGGASILPVIISPCVFESTNLAQFQVVNDPPDRPLISMKADRREMLWKNLATLIALQKWQPKERA